MKGRIRGEGMGEKVREGKRKRRERKGKGKGLKEMRKAGGKGKRS